MGSCIRMQKIRFVCKSCILFMVFSFGSKGPSAVQLANSMSSCDALCFLNLSPSLSIYIYICIWIYVGHTIVTRCWPCSHLLKRHWTKGGLLYPSGEHVKRLNFLLFHLWFFNRIKGPICGPTGKFYLVVWRPIIYI